MCITGFFMIFGTMIGLYSEVLAKSRQSQKRLAELQKLTEETDFAKSHISFYRQKGIIKKKVEVIQNLVVEPVWIKLGNGKQFKSFDFENNQSQRKRRNSSVVRKISMLASQSKAATYVMTLLITLLLTWIPYGIHLSRDMIYHIGRNETSVNLETETIEDIYACLQMIINQNLCALDKQLSEEEMDEAHYVLNHLSHVEETLYYEYFTGVIAPTFHGFINPILYALWYSEFRTYLMSFPTLFVKKKAIEPNANFDIQYIIK